jgi:Aspartyl protease
MMGLFATTLVLPLATVYPDDKLRLAVKVNNYPVELEFDTGADHTALYRSVAERLGLKITELNADKALPAGHIAVEETEECVLDAGAGPQRFRFGVVDDPPHVKPGFDGYLSWNAVSNLVLQLDMRRAVCKFLLEPPSGRKLCSKWKLSRNSRLLVFECSNGRETARIGIDTGSSSGVWLSSERWQRWRAKRAMQPATLEALWFPSDGLVVGEVLRAKKIVIGGIALQDVPVSKASPSAEIGFENCDAIFGLYVFKQRNLIVDGKSGWVDMCPIKHSSDGYAYNLLGAVFAPKDLERTDDLVAHVIKDSPSYRAGIRDGDVLVKIGLLNVTKWRTDPTILPLSRFWSQPAGTKLKLTLNRGDKEFETTVTLEELPAVD